MAGSHPSRDDRGRSRAPCSEHLLQSALDQFREECRLYNRAVGSYNTHLDNHRDRRELYDVPFRSPITGFDSFDDVLDGDRTAMEALLTRLIEQAHLDSQLRRHPRAYPIHIDAVEHLQIAREQLIATLEQAIQHSRESE